MAESLGAIGSVTAFAQLTLFFLGTLKDVATWTSENLSPQEFQAKR